MYSEDVIAHPPFQLHLEPDSPMELVELLRCLGSINRQFEIFAAAEGLSTAKDAKLLVSSVKPGSIDIGLLPDASTLASMLAPVLVYSPPVLKFASALKGLIDKFKSKPDPAATTIRDCDDAINIASPVAQHGGTQTFNVYQGDHYEQVFQVVAPDARRVLENASATKALLDSQVRQQHQRVALVWQGMDKQGARTIGARSPDKAIIEEIDPKPRPVFFADEFAALKTDMIGDEANPYRKVFFVDVDVSRAGGKVVGYRVIGYHGSDELD